METIEKMECQICEETTENSKQNKKKTIIYYSILVFALFAYIGGFKLWDLVQHKNEIKDFENSIVNIMVENGLKDVTVSATECDEYTTNWKLQIYSDDFAEIEPDKMFELDDTLPDDTEQVYISSGDTYEINQYKRIITKNGTEFYNDYKNSLACWDEEKKELERKNSNGSNSSYDNFDYAQIDLSDIEKEIWVITQKDIKERLKAPSTAKFPTLSDVSMSKSGNEVTVVGWVDAQNSFGATIRNDFIAVYRLSATSSSNVGYALKSCDIY